MTVPRKIYVRNNYFFVEQANVVNNYPSKDVFVKRQDGGYLITVNTREFFTIGLLRIGEIFKQNGTLYEEDEWVEFYTRMTAGGSESSGVNGGGGNLPYDYTATNYNELILNFPQVPEGKLAYVYEPQGTEWLWGSLGGTYYPEGYYVFNGVEWKPYRASVKIVEPVRVMLEEGKTHSNVNLTTSEIILIAKNIQRTALRITNDSNQTLLVKYGNNVNLNSYSYKLMKGDMMIENDYLGDVYGVWLNSGTGKAIISETII